MCSLEVHKCHSVVLMGTWCSFPLQNFIVNVTELQLLACTMNLQVWNLCLERPRQDYTILICTVYFSLYSCYTQWYLTHVYWIVTVSQHLWTVWFFLHTKEQHITNVSVLVRGYRYTIVEHINSKKYVRQEAWSLYYSHTNKCIMKLQNSAVTISPSGTDSSELLLLPLTYHHNHFLAATFDFMYFK